MENKKKTAVVLLALSECVQRKILEMNSVIKEIIRKAAIMGSIGKSPSMALHNKLPQLLLSLNNW